MLELIFLICMIGIFGKLCIFGMHAAWSITKLLFTVVFLPILLLVLLFSGVVGLAIPILAVVGIVALLKSE